MKKFFVCIVFLMSIHLYIYSKPSEKYVIGCKSAGLFSSFLSVLNHLAWCEKKELTPVIYWDNQSLYFTKDSSEITNNVWEYYFEPVSHEDYGSGDIIHRDFAPAPGFNLAMHFNNRKLLGDIIKSQIKIKPHIQSKIEDFYQTHIAHKKTIGIHLRGTDKIIALPTLNIQNFDNQSIFEIVNTFTGYQFYIATDEWKLLELAQKNIKGQVIYYNCTRSSDGSSLHHTPSNKNKKELGEEALIEAMLLSRCDHLCMSYSNLSFAALYFNPDLATTRLYSSIKKNYIY